VVVVVVLDPTASHTRLRHSDSQDTVVLLTAAQAIRH